MLTSSAYYHLLPRIFISSLFFLLNVLTCSKNPQCCNHSNLSKIWFLLPPIWYFSEIFHHFYFKVYYLIWHREDCMTWILLTFSPLPLYSIYFNHIKLLVMTWYVRFYFTLGLHMYLLYLERLSLYLYYSSVSFRVYSAVAYIEEDLLTSVHPIAPAESSLMCPAFVFP